MTADAVPAIDYLDRLHALGAAVFDLEEAILLALDHETMSARHAAIQVAYAEVMRGVDA